jgi:4-diphosphocytidyl-2-C-methyl-D-erythritol kinase
LGGLAALHYFTISIPENAKIEFIRHFCRMIVFPNAKINLGLQVLRKRNDGYHDINTVFYAVDWKDVLEVTIEKKEAVPFELILTGLPVAGSNDDNLISRAWKMLQAIHPLPPLRVHLHKVIPMGAGLGGGSADAAFFINAVNDLVGLGLSREQREGMAASLGSDCAFFIHNQPVYASGRGTEFSPIAIDLQLYPIALVYPNIHSNTREAYSGLTPHEATYDLRKALSAPVNTWRNIVDNDFEKTIFAKYPLLAEIKEQLYQQGAMYAAMSGSGSALFGIFDHAPQLNLPPNCLVHMCAP